MTGVLTNIATLSILANIALAVALVRAKKKPAIQYTQDAAGILNDLTSPGVALVKVERVAPETVLLRSPRDMR